MAKLTNDLEETHTHKGIVRACSVCKHPPGMHKCCPNCQDSATGFNAVMRVFGFRKPAGGTAIPQTWCRSCRSDSMKEKSDG
jgi:hypothetical protein